jgi:hypothetical protein
MEVHEPIDEEEAIRLTAHTHTVAVGARPSDAGRLSIIERARGKLAGWFFDDRIEPALSHSADRVTPALEQANSVRTATEEAPGTSPTSAMSVE